MEYPVLCHSLDKIRYFRNVLYGNDMRIRIIVGDQASKKMTALRRAVEDVEMGPARANQLCVVTPTNPVPWLPVKEPKNGSAAIVVYLRWLLDPFVEALLMEYGEENCEVVLFESDPTLG